MQLPSLLRAVAAEVLWLPLHFLYFAAAWCAAKCCGRATTGRVAVQSLPPGKSVDVRQSAEERAWKSRATGAGRVQSRSPDMIRHGREDTENILQ